jgi:hypothetical protein
VLFFGHIAISVALADAAGADTAWAVAGNLLPDVTDKTGGWVLKVMPSGRWLAHGLPFFVLANALARGALPERASRGFTLGYASHLVADHYAGGRLPLMAPFAKPRSRSQGHGLGWLGVNLVPELLGLAFHLRRHNRSQRSAN